MGECRDNPTATRILATLGPAWRIVTRISRAYARPGIAVLTALITSASGVNANPTGGEVVAGQAAISAEGDRLTVDQATNRAVIDWRGFSIDAGELTRFLQPGADAAALNRVLGGNPSELLGTLEANGAIYLINPNGIVVGPNGRIDTESFIASTLNVSIDDFLDGGSIRFQGDSGAAVVNLGEIDAAGGSVYLIAREVRNEGRIHADEHAGLAGGGAVELRFEGDERIAVALDGPAGRVDNTGHIEAARVALKAAGGNPFALAINNEGLVRARGAATTDDGRVVLSAERGTTRTAGRLEAPGGRIDVLGESVTVSGEIDTSAPFGGGEINVGGDYKGRGTLKLATTTEVTGEASLFADGRGSADGGRIVVWSEETTNVEGTLSARGGDRGGDGGLVETSSRGQLDFTRSVDVSAPEGEGGTWLLDPEDIVIDSGKADSIESTLNEGGSVSIATADGGEGKGDIDVESSITKSEGDDASLSMDAHRDINVNASIKSTHNELDLSLIAGRAVNTNASIDTNGGDLSTTVTGEHTEPREMEAEEEESRDESGSEQSDTDSESDTQSDTDSADTESEDGESGDADSDTQSSESVGDTDTAGTEASQTGSSKNTDSQATEPGGGDAQQPESESTESGDTSETMVAEASSSRITVAADITTAGGNVTVDGSQSDGTVTVDATVSASSEDAAGGEVAIAGGEVAFNEGGGAEADGTEGGSITVTAATETGDSDATGSVTLAEGATLSATGDEGDGGEISVSAENETKIAGEVDAGSQEVDGGEVTVSGDDVRIEGSAEVDASGGADGGRVRIGGDVRGGEIDTAGGTLDTAENTTVEKGARIKANAGTHGDGGTVVVWGENTTRFEGHIAARGGSESGFAEVSGLEQLEFLGTVDTGGGELLLDPFNYTIGATQGGNITTALGSNNVTIDTTTDDASFGSSGDNTQAGDITVNADLLYSEPNDLTFLAAGDVHFNASVQNKDGTGGDLNIVAGWDETTDFDVDQYNAVDVTAAPSLYGRNGGSVHIGDESQATGIAVGSRTGATRVYARDLNITAGTVSGGSDGRFAQLGFQVSNEGSTFAVEGGIRAHVTNDITAAGGDDADSLFNYVQLGHVGADQSGNSNEEAAVDVAIDVAAGNALTFRSGEGPGAYAQLGHGGVAAAGDHSGVITLEQANDRTFRGGEGQSAYAQLGHGGFFAPGNHSGAITLEQASDLTFEAGSSRNAYAQLGHGGFFAAGDHSGAITLEQASDLTFRGGQGPMAYAQLGHSGDETSGVITLTQTHDLIFEGGTSANAHAQLGHSGATTSGAITLEQANDLTFTGGDGETAYAQLGHFGGDVASGAITLTQSNDLTFEGGTSATAHAQLGHFGGETSGAITLTQTSDVTFEGGTSANAHAQLGHGGLSGTGDHSGAITLEQANDLTFTGGDGDFAYAQLGHGGDSAEGDHGGAITLTRADDLTFRGGGEQATYAQLGHGGVFAAGNHGGAITLGQASDLTFRGGDGGGGYAQLGHGGLSATGDHGGAITLAQANDVTFGGGDGVGAYAQLGHGGAGAAGDHGGTITLTQAKNLTFGGGEVQAAYAQLGHGGVLAGGNPSGAIDVTHAGDLTLTGRDVDDQYALIGHGDAPGDSGNDSGESVTGDVLLRTDGNADLENAFIGHLIDGDGAYDGGNTYVGVLGSLTTDAASALNSAPHPDGELRIYLADPANDLVADGTALNGVDHGATQSPNNQGQFVFGAGPYNVPGGDVIGEFNYYTLPDAVNYIVDGLAAGNIVAALANGSVLLETTPLGRADFGAEPDTDGGTSFIRVDSSLLYDSPHSLGLVATGDVTFNVSVQNENATGGDINIVAGWDGSTAFDATQYNTIDVSGAPGAFGNDGDPVHDGDVFVDNQTSGIAVGSRTGATRVYARGLNLTASPEPLAFAQLGFQVTDGVALSGTDLDPDNPHGENVVVEGGLRVHVLEDITATGGGVPYAYAQLGHVGADLLSHFDTEAVVDAAIDVAAGNDLTFTGGGSFGAYAQLGHGGRGAAGGHSGAITLTQANDLTFEGDAGYAHLGHGGNSADGDHSGAIRVARPNDLSFTAGDGEHAYVHLGHGGYDADGDHSGAITVTQANDLSFEGGNDFQAYAHLGHGGFDADGDHSGAITLTQTNDLSFEGGSVPGAYAHLGHGGRGATGDHSGAITLTQANDLTFEGGIISGGYAHLGHGGDLADGNHSGAITLTRVNDLAFTGGRAELSYVQLGHGGHNADGNHSGAITLTQANDLTFTGGSESNVYAHLGHGGFEALGNHSGAITVTQVNDLTFSGGSNTAAYAQLGHGGRGAAGDHSGAVTLTRVNDLMFASGNDEFAYAHLGHGGFFASGDHNGAITLTQANDLSFTGGSGNNAYAHLGHGGVEAVGNHNGAITLTRINDLSFEGGSVSGAYAHLGHGGAGAVGDHDGTIMLTQANDLTFATGSDSGTYAHLGHGGVFADGDHSGVIDLTHAGDLALTGQDIGDYQYALIGHGDDPGDDDAGEVVSGDVLIRTGGNTMLEHAFIGHLIDDRNNYTAGNTFIGVAGDLTADANSAFNSAPAGELRIYLPSAANDLIHPNASLNSEPHGPNPGPNSQGEFTFGSGPYNPARGNFAFYVSSPPPVDAPAGNGGDDGAPAGEGAPSPPDTSPTVFDTGQRRHKILAGGAHGEPCSRTSNLAFFEESLVFASSYGDEACPGEE